MVIRCFKLKKGQSSQTFNHHIELISKLRHRHLVNALGHCFDYYLDDSSVSRLFLIFEYVANGTLRTNISGTKAIRLMESLLPIFNSLGILIERAQNLNLFTLCKFFSFSGRTKVYMDAKDFSCHQHSKGYPVFAWGYNARLIQ